MQPFLIISGTLEKRKIKAVGLIKKIDPGLVRQNHPDLLTLNDQSPSIGIEEIRRFQKSVYFKPFQSKTKVAIIPEAEKLTIPAQNALLKTLEEPPASTQIILLAPKAEILLPTIVSRCLLFRLAAAKTVPGPETLVFLDRLLTAGVGERLQIAEGYKNRDAAKEIINNLLAAWRYLLLAKSNFSAAELQIFAKTASVPSIKRLDLAQITAAIRQTEKVRRLLKANINPQLVLDNLFLDYPPQVHPKGDPG